MGTITAQTVIDDAWELANDTGTRWPALKCLPALNDGQREIVTFLPSANTVRAVPTMVAGTRQTAAGLGLADLVQFLDVPRNFASNGTTPGIAVRLVPNGRVWFDENRPGWHTETPVASVKHCFTDEKDPKALYVWPPSDGTGKLEILYAGIPAPIASLVSVITLDDIYKNALMYYLLSRMKAKNKPGGSSPGDAQAWYSAFLKVLGIKDQRVMRNDQNVRGDA